MGTYQYPDTSSSCLNKNYIIAYIKKKPLGAHILTSRKNSFYPKLRATLNEKNYVGLMYFSRVSLKIINQPFLIGHPVLL
jgi:hypothetical protein